MRVLAARGHIDSTQLRIDSTVVEANIAPPHDSKLLDDAIRVLSQHLAMCHKKAGLKLRFAAQRRKFRRLSFAVFYVKDVEKESLYPKLLACAFRVLKQVDGALVKLESRNRVHVATAQWIEKAQLYYQLLCRVIYQTQQRVYE